MTITLGNKIGEGGCSEVFDIGNKQIIKLAKENTSIEAAKREYLNNSIAWECGLSVPQPFDLTEVDGRPGIIVEHIIGETMMERIIKSAIKNDEIIQDDIRLTAQQLYNVHKTLFAGHELPNQKNVIKSHILSVNYLTAHEKESVISLLDSLPTRQCMCHGDPNPGNIMIKNDGKAVLIDWSNATVGNPEADIAEYILMIRYAILPPHFREDIRHEFEFIREKLITIFMDEYTKLSGIAYDEVVPWLTPIAARKLSADAISDLEKEKLLEEIRRTLMEIKGKLIQ
ncbi:phosphotransferase [Paenibacillus popilliae]|uniref:Aminoglycoside phosphotransferase n=1 Tax=Paenibacillus popilliae TaxID=78057 RepID=A0ABY3ATI4_PAEPP|nr:phosphotransferase [Paenibacillus sp. SDF0028]TQR45942.1 aminoglycoside phosphotransferase [Paenibacillus sp. SDF0028]